MSVVTIILIHHSQHIYNKCQHTYFVIHLIHHKGNLQLHQNTWHNSLNIPERIIKELNLKNYHLRRTPLCRVQPVTALKETETDLLALFELLKA